MAYWPKGTQTRSRSKRENLPSQVGPVTLQGPQCPHGGLQLRHQSASVRGGGQECHNAVILHSRPLSHSKNCAAFIILLQEHWIRNKIGFPSFHRRKRDSGESLFPVWMNRGGKGGREETDFLSPFEIGIRVSCSKRSKNIKDIWAPCNNTSIDRQGVSVI